MDGREGVAGGCYFQKIKNPYNGLLIKERFSYVVFSTPRETLFFYQPHSPDFFCVPDFEGCVFLFDTVPTRLLRIYHILRIFCVSAFEGDCFLRHCV